MTWFELLVLLRDFVAQIPTPYIPIIVEILRFAGNVLVASIEGLFKLLTTIAARVFRAWNKAPLRKDSASKARKSKGSVPRACQPKHNKSGLLTPQVRQPAKRS